MGDKGEPVCGPGMVRIWAPEAFLEDEAFAPVVEINEQALGAMRRLALAGGEGGCAFLRELRPLWEDLDEAALRRAARCPYALLDADFAEPRRWRAARGYEVCDEQRPESIFEPAEAQPLARLLLTYAWHLARTRRFAARFVLGLSAANAEAIAASTLAQITRVAESGREWLAPRWPQRLDAWRELLEAARTGEPGALERAQLRGLQMLAGDAWRAAGESGRPAPGAGQALPASR
ncbi:MAG: hypothetical protein IPI06_11295 [Gammaproteobacteria bacterium]|nr:hypothetical protein [Gammaproteobacteria bacterium]